ncbi:MAG: hypothetical protein EOP02_00570 [Proteobacteria bacterium]|nr:MAG: hypothetical protein EOP02_00570 [Pseudomonadota bacterium]
MTERRSNIEFVADLMTFSAHGALVQVFVLQALGQYAQRVAACEPQALETALVSGQAWRGCALEVQRKLDEHLDSGPRSLA